MRHQILKLLMFSRKHAHVFNRIYLGSKTSFMYVLLNTTDKKYLEPFAEFLLAMNKLFDAR